MTLDEGRNLAGAVSEQQIPLPMSWYRPIFNRGWTLVAARSELTMCARLPLIM
jgi:hypothetical protein